MRQIGLWSAVAVVVGSTIGSGIFRTPSSVAEHLPGPLPMMSVWLVAGLFVLCGALTLAELGGAFPYAGGLYVFLREAYGRLMAFLFGWAQLVLIRPAANGAVALVFAEYALRLAGRTPGTEDFVRGTAILAIAALVVVAAANYRGVRYGTGLQNLTTIAKTGGLLVLVALAYAMALPHAASNFVPAAPPGSFTFSAFGLALVNVLWAFDGWADVSYVAGEVKDPRRNVPRAILIGTLAITAVYLLANLAYLAVFSTEEIAGSDQIAADVMGRLFGAPGLTFIVATVMISTFGTVNGSMLTAPRVYFAMAEDGLFFKPVAQVHPRFKTPHVATVTALLLSATFVIVATWLSESGAFARLTNAFVTALVPFYGLSVASVFVFRARERRRSQALGQGASAADESVPSDAAEPAELASMPDHPPYDPPARTPLYPLVPLTFILSSVWLLANALADKNERPPTLITLAILAAGVPVYFATVGRRMRGVS